ncbi:hypothetical protein CAZ07_35255, partial [Pseudomonas aeruginosa]|uniref:response regulator n=1 Tax=Pseudomonas aeruginosa TaxID=287 RepID=UPI000B742B7F
MENLGLGKVLLVEDDEKLAGLVSHFLSQHGFEVRVVYRGDEALAAFVDFKPKIVVLDLMLPGQSGLHVCREIRNVSDTPIVILTAKEDDLDHILCLESGADDYVIKPIKPPVLLARLRALQRRQVPEPTRRVVFSYAVFCLKKKIHILFFIRPFPLFLASLPSSRFRILASTHRTQHLPL